MAGGLLFFAFLDTAVSVAAGDGSILQYRQKEMEEKNGELPV